MGRPNGGNHWSERGLGRALTKALIGEGAWVIALSHSPPPKAQASIDQAQEWVRWSCGDERQLEPILKNVDVLVLNHGINPGGDQCPETLSKTLEVNAFSHWRLMQQFETIADQDQNRENPRELWVNTSEAEIQPALSPGYELSKRLIGELVSLRWNNRTASQRQALRLRKLILGPFRSNLNPIGLLTSGFVANQVIWQANLGVNLIIVTPNPLHLPSNALRRTGSKGLLPRLEDQSPRSVRISHPSDVTTMVCSH